MSEEAPAHIQVLHLILEQALTDRASEVLLQYDATRYEFAVYFKRDTGYEEVLAPPTSLFKPMQEALAMAGHLRLPEGEGHIILPRQDGGRLRYAIAIEDGGATMALSPQGYC